VEGLVCAASLKVASGYRTARGSERDKNSTNRNDGVVVIVLIKILNKSGFSLRPYPARYRERFCTRRFVGFQAPDSKATNLIGQSWFVRLRVISWIVVLEREELLVR